MSFKYIHPCVRVFDSLLQHISLHLNTPIAPLRKKRKKIIRGKFFFTAVRSFSLLLYRWMMYIPYNISRCLKLPMPNFQSRIRPNICLCCPGYFSPLYPTNPTTFKGAHWSLLSTRHRQHLWIIRRTFTALRFLYRHDRLFECCNIWLCI
jgi:hypothetical protein